MHYIKTLITAIVVAGVITPPALSKDIPTLKDFDMKRCVNMGNSLDAPRNAEWGAPINVTDFAKIKSAGFDTVRIPVRWSDYTSGAPDYRIEADFINDVERIVDAALAQNLNVILNVHHFDKIMETPKAELRKLVAMWRQIATRFSKHPKDLWFETLNEPNKNLKGNIMRAAQTAAILAIRETNADRIIMLGGEEWSGINSLPTNIMPPDENIIYTYHYYDPYNFTHQKAKWLGKNMPKGTRDWGNREDKRNLDVDIQKVISFRDAVKRPVFVGEFGVYDDVTSKERVKYVRGVREALEAADIPWCLWSFTNTFALYNNETNKFDEDMLSALGLDPATQRLKTGVVSQSDVTPANESWGKFLPYYEGESQHIEDILTGVAVINPGEQIHPPHRHPEEEFLMILEGSGTWTIEAKDMPASSGDIMYSNPGELHGLRNTGSVPLKFVVFKYNPKQ